MDLPLFVRKHEFPQLQIPKDDAVPMADLDSFGDLFEEFAGFRFTETLPGADVGMEVAVGTRKNQVQIAIAHEDLVE